MLCLALGLSTPVKRARAVVEREEELGADDDLSDLSSLVESGA